MILKLLHMDLMGLVQVESLRGKGYVFVSVNEFSTYSFIHFLREKSNTFDAFETSLLRLMLEANLQYQKVIQIRSDHEREFENSHFDKFCNKHSIRHEYSAPKTPQQNGPIQFWAKALNRACYIQNQVYLLPGTSMTPYEIWRGKKPNLKHLHEFGSTCFVLNDREHIR